MIAAVDVHYEHEFARVACVLFEAWTDAAPIREFSLRVPAGEPYQPGEFWRRELPCLLAALQRLKERPRIVIVDGYVWLDDSGRKGLGAHLFDALGGACAVVGVAKSAFRNAPHAALIRCGTSQRPLYVTAHGLPLPDAASAVESMYGPHRIPTLLQRVDALCRNPPTVSR